ncbi:MAG: universal stress protein [Solirubrobacterales bacterium]
MFQKILVGFQDTPQGRDAKALGQALARLTAAQLVVATITADEHETLGDLAREQGADLAVLGSTHRGPVGRIVPGAAVAHLLADPPCAVAVAPPGFSRPGGAGDWRPLDGDGEDPGLRVLGVGFDASHAAQAALETAAELALAGGAAMRVYTIAQKLPQIHATETASPAAVAATETETLRSALQAAVAELPRAARALPVFLRGDPATELIDAVGNGVDLLVLGSRPGGPLRRVLQGSVTDAVLAAARCPVLIVPAALVRP